MNQLKSLRSFNRTALLASPLLLGLLAGCATFAPATAVAPAASADPPHAGAVHAGTAAAGASAPRSAHAAARGASGPSAAAAAGGGLPPFAENIKDPRRTGGLFTIWQRDDKV